MQRKKVFKGRTEETESQQQQQQQLTTQEHLANNPIPRVNGTLTPWSDGILLVGGESLLKKTKGSKAGTLFHQDILLFNMETMQWSPLPLSSKAPSPPPRSSHQSVLLNDTTLYLWGGECELGGSTAAGTAKDKVKISKKKAKKDKERFMHYGGSMWSLCKGSREWKVLPSMPPATASKPPSSRSGHRMIPFLKDYLLLFGGFHDTGSQTQYHDDTWIFCTKTAGWMKLDCASSPAARSGFCFANLNGGTPTIYGGYTQRKRTSGRLEGHVFGDIWTLKLCDSECPEKGGEWKKRSPLHKELAPNPLRSGISSTALAESNLLFLFGGICDEVGVEDEFILGMCRNDSFIYDSCLNSWCSLTISSSSAIPAPRFNATITTTTTTSGEKVIIYGGMYEYGDREWILDDVWEFQLAKVGETSYEGSFTCLKEVSVELRDIFKIKEMVSEDDDDDDDEDDDEDDENEDNNDENEDEKKEQLSRKIPQVRKEKTLKEYFDKSQDYWIAKAKDELLEADGEADHPKMVRKLAFKMAKDDFEGQSGLLELCDL